MKARIFLNDLFGEPEYIETREFNSDSDVKKYIKEKQKQDYSEGEHVTIIDHGTITTKKGNTYRKIEAISDCDFSYVAYS